MDFDSESPESQTALTVSERNSGFLVDESVNPIGFRFVAAQVESDAMTAEC